MNPSSFPSRSWLSVLALAASLAAQGPHAPFHPYADPAGMPARRALPPHADGPLAARLLREGPGGGVESVIFDAPGDGCIWASGATYKASFGADGFTFVPFLGSDAPKDYPVQFQLRSVRVGGHVVALTADAPATREGMRVTFDRGLVREVYDLTPRGVEQTFVVDGDLAGDVDVELDVATELTEDAAQAGLQFGNQLGHVEYGTAWLVNGQSKSEIPASLAGRSLRLHVPAAQRGAGPVVIDPIIRTVQMTPTTMTSEIPDVAYDATTDHWMVVWVHVFSQTDNDVVGELRTGNGDSIAGSFMPIDNSTISHSWPRVANLNSADKFLVGMERFVPSNPAGQQYTIRGRIISAAAPFTTSGLLTISPASTQDQLSVDVGGDSGTGTKWLVVYRHGTDIHARTVDANGTISPNVIPVETTASDCINPQVSISNGNGLTATPRWLVVYMLKVSDTNWDVYGAVLDENGGIQVSHSAISNGSSNDLYCYVSSPMTDLRPVPAYLVSYERQTTSTPELIVKLIDANFNTLVSETNLTRRYGFSGLYTRVESDGIRFAVTCQINNRIQVGTLAYIGNALVLHEALQDLGTGDSPALASRRSGGGGPTEYGVVYDTTNVPARINLARYEGRAPAGGFNRRSTSCGLSINSAGRPYLGDVVQFTISNANADLPLLILGIPIPELPVCANCKLGLDLARPLIVFGAPMSLTLPSEPILVGGTLAVQGFAIGSGSCPGPLRMSDTIDFTIQ